MRAFGDELRDAAAGHHQDQGGDDRLDTEHRDQKAVPQPASKADAERGGERHRQADAGVDKARGDRAADRHDRADRQVDARAWR